MMLPTIIMESSTTMGIEDTGDGAENNNNNEETQTDTETTATK